VWQAVERRRQSGWTVVERRPSAARAAPQLSAARSARSGVWDPLAPADEPWSFQADGGLAGPARSPARKPVLWQQTAREQGLAAGKRRACVVVTRCGKKRPRGRAIAHESREVWGSTCHVRRRTITPSCTMAAKICPSPLIRQTTTALPTLRSTPPDAFAHDHCR